MKKIMALVLAVGCVLCTGCAEYHSIATKSESSQSETTAVESESTSEAEKQETTLPPETTSDTKESASETETEKGSDGYSSSILIETDNGTVEAGVKDGVLTFADVKGEVYETDFEEEWPRNDYDVSAFEYDENGRMTYTGDGYTYRLGIDVYEGYGDIDWEAVKADGYDFAIIRAGYRGYLEPGTVCRDDMVWANLRAALDAGLDVGVYFFSQAVDEDEAVEEAEFVIDTLLNNGFTQGDITMGVTFDPESILEDDARTDQVTGEQFTKNAVAFCERLAQDGFEGMVYCNMLWEAYKLDLGELSDYPVWYADYWNQPQSPYDFTIWQYGHGESEGVEGAVDVNIQLIPEE